MSASSPRLRSNPLAVMIEDPTNADAAYLLSARSTAQMTYDGLREEVRRLGPRFGEAGVPLGGRVGLMLSDPLTFSAWFLSGLAHGYWVAPLDPSPSPSNLTQVVERAAALRLDAVISDQRGPDGVSTPWRIASNLRGSSEPSRGEGEGGVLLSSSGTTGTPKVMALGLAQLLATARLIADHNELQPGDRGFSPLPLWHVNAEVVGLLSSLVAGSSLVLDERFHRTGFWKIVDDFDVTWINAVPAIISRLLSLDGDERPSPRVRFIRSASAPLSAQLLEHFESMTGVAVVESYGMTEAASQICANPLRGVRKPGSVGPPVGVEVRVATNDRATHDGPSVGDIEIRGPSVIRSYESAAYDDRFDAEGWLRTGDLGYFDDDGYLFIVGRNDDVINRGGEKIYPLEIENALADVAGVAAVAVIGEADDVFGQVPVAFVQPSDATVFSTPAELEVLVERLTTHARDVFARSHRPSAIRLVAAFPSHATGKIQKGPLRRGDVAVLAEATL